MAGHAAKFADRLLANTQQATPILPKNKRNNNKRCSDSDVPNSMLIPVGNSKNSLYQKLEVRQSRSTLHQLCFVKSKPPLPTVPEAWGPWEPQHPPPSHYGCIMLAKNRVVVFKIWTTGYWLWSWLFCICDCWKSMKNCRDSSLSLRGLEARLPAFKLPMFAKCDALKEICSTCLSNGIHAFCEI